MVELVVARGFATVIKHRTDEERSCVYERCVGGPSPERIYCERL